MKQSLSALLVSTTLAVGAGAQCSTDWVLGRNLPADSDAAQMMLAYDSGRDLVQYFRFNYGNPADVGVIVEPQTPFDSYYGTYAQPEGRYGGRMTFDPVRNVTVLVGGTQLTGVSRTWEWHGQPPSGLGPLTAMGSWTSSTQLPGGNRSFFAMGYDPVSQRVLVHGGLGGPGGSQTLSSTYAWDGAAWTLLSAGAPETARSHTQMVYYAPRNAMVMFGGLDAQGQTRNDLLEWTGTEWQPVPQQNPPYARQGHAFAYDPNRERLMVIGGFGNATLCSVDDVWEFDGAAWTRAGDTPAPCRADASAVFDQAHGHVVVYNGASVWAYGGGRPVVLRTPWTWYRSVEVRRIRPSPGSGGAITTSSWFRVVSATPVSYRWQVLDEGAWRDLHDGPLVVDGLSLGTVAGTGGQGLVFPTLNNDNLTDGLTVKTRLAVSNACGATTLGSLEYVWIPYTCGDIDFNNDGLFPDTLDIDALLCVFSGGPCLVDGVPDGWQGCDSIDFNNDGLFPDVLDIVSYISVYSGGPCL